MFEDFSGPESAPPGPYQARSQALQVLVDGILQGSLLTLAVCTPKRGSVFTSQTANRQEKFRTYIVSMPGTEPSVEEPRAQSPSVEVTPVAR
jgi:hypothetical protein